MLNDFYPTPAAITEGLVNSVSITGSIFEPCAGHNAITDVLNQHPGIHAVGSDLLWIVPDKHTTNDATDPQFWQEWGKFAWVVTNPPFSEAEKILPLAYEHAAIGVAFLLRLSWLEPCNGRAQWMINHADQLEKIITVSPRVRFRTDTNGSDSVTCAWFVWREAWSWKSLGLDCPFEFLRDWRN
jgi:hypothetical protein